MNLLIDKFQTTRQFLLLLLREFVRHDCLNSAAALTYTTLLSLVPLMTVTLAVFAAFPISDTVSQQAQDFVFHNFVPEAGEALSDHFSRFSANASRLSGMGFFFLILVAMMLMMTIHSTFRTIWDSKGSRSLLSQFLMYWAVLTIGPLLIGLSVAVSSYLFSLPLFADNIHWSAGKQILKLVPMTTSWLAFSMFYMVIPNRKVPVLHAVAGGFVAAILFEAAKRGFGLYISFFPTYQAIYGALAAIPIFLVWLYLSWMVTLLGAEFTHCLTVFQRRHNKETGIVDGHIDLTVALDIIFSLAEAQKQGKAISTSGLIGQFPQINEHSLDDLLYLLRSKQWLILTDNKDWVLARDLHQMTVKQLYMDTNLPLPLANKASSKYQQINDIDEYVMANLDISVQEVLGTCQA